MEGGARPPQRGVGGQAEPRLLTGLCCLVYDPGSHTAAVTPTSEPCAAVSLEHLAIALQCVAVTSGNSFVSLDPLEGQELGSMSQCR